MIYLQKKKNYVYEYGLTSFNILAWYVTSNCSECILHSLIDLGYLKMTTEKKHSRAQHLPPIPSFDQPPSPPHLQKKNHCLPNITHTDNIDNMLPKMFFDSISSVYSHIWVFKNDSFCLCKIPSQFLTKLESLYDKQSLTTKALPQLLKGLFSHNGKQTKELLSK